MLRARVGARDDPRLHASVAGRRRGLLDRLERRPSREGRGEADARVVCSLALGLVEDAGGRGALRVLRDVVGEGSLELPVRHVVDGLCLALRHLADVVGGNPRVVAVGVAAELAERTARGLLRVLGEHGLEVVGQLAVPPLGVPPCGPVARLEHLDAPPVGPEPALGLGALEGGLDLAALPLEEGAALIRASGLAALRRGAPAS